jgi:glycosyltransferase involved in cell wall biosynthesis
MINKVLFISHHSIPLTGAHKRFDRLVVRLSRSSDNVLWITPQRKDDLKNINVNFLIINDLFNKSFVSVNLVYEVLKFAKILFQLRGDIAKIVVFGETCLPAATLVSFLVNSILSVAVRSNVPKRSFISRQNYSFFKKNIAYFRFLIWHCFLFLAYRYAKHITVQTPRAKDEFYLHYRVNKNKIDVIPNDMPKNFILQARTNVLPKTPKSIIFVGNASRIKGFDILVDAIKKASNHIVIEKVTLVGVQNEEALELITFCYEVNIELKIIPRSNNIVALMKEHDLVIVPSREDQFPNVVLEALALKMPVIGANVDGIAFMLQSKDALFDISDNNSLVTLLFRVFTEEGYTNIIDNTLAQRERFDFDWENEYFDCIKKVYG